MSASEVVVTVDAFLHGVEFPDNGIEVSDLFHRLGFDALTTRGSFELY